MKKYLAVALCLMCVALMWPRVIFADTTEETNREYLPDGSYFETVLTVEPGLTRDMTRRVGSKSSIYYDSKGVAKWKVILTGVFYYDGTTSRCDESHINVVIYDSAWKQQSKQEYGQKNTANGTITMVYSLNGSTPFTVSKTLKVTCDKDGNIS